MSRTAASISSRHLAQASQSALRQCTIRQPIHLVRSNSSSSTAPTTPGEPPHPKPRRRLHPDDDRSSLIPERSEYTNSGTDNEIASQRSAFDPKNIDPVLQAQASGEEVRQDGDVGNPLEVSPANREVSRTFDPMEGGAQRGMDRGPSQRFSPRKGTKVSMAGWTGVGEYAHAPAPAPTPALPGKGKGKSEGTSSTGGGGGGGGGS